MPTYSYACTECDNRFDIVQSFSDDTLTECPQCTGKLRKLFNSVGIVFKGSGFYRTDSRGGASTASEPAKGSSDGKSGSDSNGGGGNGGGGTATPSTSTTTPAAAG
ncbi:FmdB family zinc ribbon protein [Nocardia halotolerans]|uniref:FmdB family zinc ribbon protein n=1 Tax=Nocardia halotolerans TaxID=1755878 RepID=A0ABV8VLS1_9NOCA